VSDFVSEEAYLTPGRSRGHILMLESNHETELQRPVVELWPQIIHWLGPGINITVGHQPLAEQNADMAVHWLLCTDIMADRFVYLFEYFFRPLLFQLFFTKSVILNTCKQRFRLLDKRSQNLTSVVVVTVLVYSTVTTDLSLLRKIECLVMSDQNMGCSDIMSDQVFTIILNSGLGSTLIRI
jgi:hypothetical protein